MSGDSPLVGRRLPRSTPSPRLTIVSAGGLLPIAFPIGSPLATVTTTGRSPRDLTTAVAPSSCLRQGGHAAPSAGGSVVIPVAPVFVVPAVVVPRPMGGATTAISATPARFSPIVPRASSVAVAQSGSTRLRGSSADASRNPATVERHDEARGANPRDIARTRSISRPTDHLRACRHPNHPSHRCSRPRHSASTSGRAPTSIGVQAADRAREERRSHEHVTPIGRCPGGWRASLISGDTRRVRASLDQDLARVGSPDCCARCRPFTYLTAVLPAEPGLQAVPPAAANLIG